MDAKTQLPRIAERRAFELHAKERPGKERPAKERPAVEQADIPGFLDRVCQQHSVSFTKDDTLRQKQAFPFMSPE